MRNFAIAIALIVFVAVGMLFFYNKKNTAPPDPSLVANPKVAPAHHKFVSSESIPPTSDMSLPMPLGLKGDPEKGRIFFMGNCFTCHGIKGDGDGPRAYFITPPPRDFLLETSRKRLNRPVLFEAITYGRLGTNMPAWGKVLSPQEVADVAEFVFENFIHPSGETGNQSK